MKRSFVLGIVLCATACARHGKMSALVAGCPTSTSAKVATITPADFARLTGEFRLVQVVTSDTLGRPYAYETLLTLMLADSGQRERARERRLGNLPRDFQIVGSRGWPSQNMREPAELDGIGLRLGCVECFDASPDYLRVEQISTDGFTGSWSNSQSGIGRIVRKNGTFAPDPAGHFCAHRITTAPSGDV